MTVLAPLAENWMAWMADASWRAALVGVGLWLVDPILIRIHWPELRHGLWLLVPLALMMPPEVAWPWGGILPSASAGGAAVPVAAGDTALASALLGVWAVTTISLVLLACRRAHLWAAAWRGRTRPANARVQASARRAAHRLGLSRLPRIVVDPEGAGPLVTGWLLPVVLLPATGAATWSEADLEHVLCHELAHVRRGDLLVDAAVTLVTALFWFHPAAHLARRRAHAARELCCDASVAARVGLSYRRTLVRMAAGRLLASTPTRGLGLGGPRSLTLLRLRALERLPVGGRGHRRIAALGTVLLLACTVLPPSVADRRARELALARSAARTALGGKSSGYSSLQARMAILRLNALESGPQAVVAPPPLSEPR